MKSPVFFILGMILLVGMSCEKESVAEPIVCEGDCLFMLDNVEGKMVYMDCFSRFSIQAEHPDEETTIYGIPDTLADAYQEEGLTVRFSAEARSNQLAPAFPDPSFDESTLYQIKLMNISKAE